MSSDDEFTECAYEQILLNINECFVYKVTPLKTASGHRAEDWNLANPLFTGFLRVIGHSEQLKIIIYAYRDPTTLLASDENLVKFGECPVEVPPHGDITTFVDAVIDSSRYYVLRIKDPNPGSLRSTLLGIGFRDREVSFDFKNVLNEYVRFVDRMDAAKKLAERRAAGDNSADLIELCSSPGSQGNDTQQDNLILRDLTLKEGFKITIPLPRNNQGVSRRERKLKSFGSFGTIAPPPPAGSTIFSVVPNCTSPTATGPDSGDFASEEEEWGSFDEADDV